MNIGEIVKDRIDRFAEGYIFTYSNFDIEAKNESALKGNLKTAIQRNTNKKFLGWYYGLYYCRCISMACQYRRHNIYQCFKSFQSTGTALFRKKCPKR